MTRIDTIVKTTLMGFRVSYLNVDMPEVREWDSPNESRLAAVLHTQRLLSSSLLSIEGKLLTGGRKRSSLRRRDGTSITLTSYCVPATFPMLNLVVTEIQSSISNRYPNTTVFGLIRFLLFA